MAYRNTNSFDGEECKFDNTSFKYIFKKYCNKSGYTQKQVLENLGEQISVPVETIKNWLKSTKPTDGEISKDGKINENATIVKTAKYFKIDVKKLLMFSKNNKKEEIMDLVAENHNTQVKRYNNVQIKTLEKLNDVVMQYMILKCHIMDSIADNNNFMEYFDYTKLVSEKFNTFQGVSVDDYKGLYIEKDEEQKQKAKEEEIKKLEKNILIHKKDNGKLNISKMSQVILDNIDDYMKGIEEQERENFRYKMKYNVDDGELARWIDDKCKQNSAYGYVQFEIEKASTILRKEFIISLKYYVEFLYNIYDDCSFTTEDIINNYFTDNNGKRLIQDTNDFSFINLVKDLFSKEFSTYC